MIVECGIAARPADELVGTGSALERVVADSGDEAVVSRRADERLALHVAHQHAERLRRGQAVVVGGDEVDRVGRLRLEIEGDAVEQLDGLAGNLEQGGIRPRQRIGDMIALVGI